MGYIKIISLMAAEISRELIQEESTLKGNLKAINKVVTSIVLTDTSFTSFELLKLYSVAIEVLQDKILDYWSRHIRSYNKKFEFYEVFNSSNNIYDILIMAFDCLLKS